MPKRSPVKAKRQRMIIEFIQKRKRPKGIGPPCIFCHSNTNAAAKVYASGCIVTEHPGERNRIHWTYQGVVHEACAEKAREEKKRELGIS